LIGDSLFDSTSKWVRRPSLPLLGFVAALVLVGCSSTDDVFSPPVGPAVVRVFVTSDATDGNLGGLAGADAFCTNAAMGAGLTGSWRAWMSDSGTDARSRIVDAEYRLLNGVAVANDLADLTDGSLDNGIDVDEFGNVMMAGLAVWTGTNADGTRASNHCRDWDWSGGEVEFGQFGFTGATNSEWTNRVNNATCQAGVFSWVYCFEAMPSP
jgi:hypothetical protein